VTAYGTVIGLTMAAASFQRERERERREAALAIQARDAELGAIRSQFQPHFVLNALNSLLALIERDPAAARAMVVRLADVMKEVFDREDTPLVPLSRELDLVRAYLDVEQMRFGQRLTVDIDVPAAPRAVPVPAFLLQPIVENAVKHGIAPVAGAGRIAIAAALAGDDLVITVTDSGRRGVGVPAGGGRGLSLTRRRLQTMYGERQSLTLDGGPSGTVARITLPARIQ
jgi:LytS/YehU family sensor histidine kinase